jgi:hypothetical protein
MTTRQRVYGHLNVTTDEAAHNAIVEHLDEQEGRLITWPPGLFRNMAGEPVWVVLFKPYLWSDYPETEVSGASRYEAMINLMAALLKHKAVSS